MQLLKNQTPEAKQAFIDLVNKFPDDPLARFHLVRLVEKGEKGLRAVMSEK